MTTANTATRLAAAARDYRDVMHRAIERAERRGVVNCPGGALYVDELWTRELHDADRALTAAIQAAKANP